MAMFDAAKAAYVKSESYQSQQRLHRRINDASIPIWGGTHNRIAIGISDLAQTPYVTYAAMFGDAKDYDASEYNRNSVPDGIKDSAWGKALYEAQKAEVEAATHYADGYSKLATLNITGGFKAIEAGKHSDALVPLILPLEGAKQQVVHSV